MKFGTSLFVSLVLALSSVNGATAQGPAAERNDIFARGCGKLRYQFAEGRLDRPDGGYTIVIRSIGPTGQLDAMYFNPSPLPFAKAQASRAGDKLRAFFELRAVDTTARPTISPTIPRPNRLTGIYYQAVAKQRFDVSFARK